jgi:GDPmannose 4,6-dehydratase
MGSQVSNCMGKRALITGITGQDGSYLAELLLSKGYEVFGLVRRNSITEHQQSRLDHAFIAHRVQNVYGDLLDASSLNEAVKNAKPDEVYNLAAQSHVRISFEIPQFTTQVNALGALNMLEAVRRYAPEARYYQASSSEMFGNSVDIDRRQRETTPMHPVSPYGCAKLFAYHATRHYRESYGLFACNGILFNHESPRRAANFVTQKIIKNAKRIKHQIQAGVVPAPLELGNLDAARDWGYARDYVRAMHAIVNHTRPDDFVVATGEAHTVREFCRLVFDLLGLDHRDWVRVNPKFLRPNELDYLCGDATKIKNTLGWAHAGAFKALIRRMLVGGDEVST